jgi:hypothetical protein
VRTSVTIALFTAGVVVGVAFATSAPPRTIPEGYPPLPAVPEPAVTSNLALALEVNDAGALSAVLDRDSLTGLTKALRRITGVRQVQFTGAAGRGSYAVVGYVARGRGLDGADAIAGFTVSLLDGEIVSVR